MAGATSKFLALAEAGAGGATVRGPWSRRRHSTSRLSLFFSVRLFCSAAAAAAATCPAPPSAAPSSSSHPWPEWERFLDKLKSKGYLEDGEVSTSFGATGGEAGGDGNLVKDACIKFARDRYDLLRSLPKQDIKLVVENGCPSLVGKAVDSAKRLRAYLKLSEGKVCGNCKFHGSCDRAYLQANENGGARTVDIVRILSTYATDASNLSGYPLSKQGHESAKRLLSELIELIETTIDPSLSKIVFSSSNNKESPSKVVQRIQQSVVKSKETHEVEMKRGDWLCPKCNYMNFSRNLCCLKCMTDGPRKIDNEGAEMKLGDWTCPKCKFMNFSRNKKCLRCYEVRPERMLQPGEWECPSCSYINYSRNRVCRKCDHDRPEVRGDRRERSTRVDLEPGDWECPSCSFINFSRNMKCRECANGRPEDKTDQYRNNSWGKPKPSVNFRDTEDNDDDDETNLLEHEHEFVEKVRERKLKSFSYGDADADEYEEDITPFHNKNMTGKSKTGGSSGRIVRERSSLSCDAISDQDKRDGGDIILPLETSEGIDWEFDEILPTDHRNSLSRRDLSPHDSNYTFADGNKGRQPKRPSYEKKNQAK